MEPPLSLQYCTRTKPKHGHIAVANPLRSFGQGIFLSRLGLEQLAQVGVCAIGLGALKKPYGQEKGSNLAKWLITFISGQLFWDTGLLKARRFIDSGNNSEPL